MDTTPFDSCCPFVFVCLALNILFPEHGPRFSSPPCCSGAGVLRLKQLANEHWHMPGKLGLLIMFQSCQGFCTALPKSSSLGSNVQTSSKTNYTLPGVNLCHISSYIVLFHCFVKSQHQGKLYIPLPGSCQTQLDGDLKSQACLDSHVRKIVNLRGHKSTQNIK